MNTILNILRLADMAVVKVTRMGVILGMLILFVLLMIRIIARAAEIPFVAFDEIGELATVYMILSGVIAMWRTGTLYSVNFHVGATSRASMALNLFIQIVMIAFAAAIIWQGGKFTMMNREHSAFLLINMDYYYGAIPAAAAVMCIYSLRAAGLWLVALISGELPDGLSADMDGDISSGHL